ncbi:energy-coupling factor transporter transmembrane component T [Paenibacillus urinalis]|uniref:Energy-coupling factor transporter transmembrane component T n=1 Tax=Paenibacillus urinalis TaxID=521520 RepID=A0ABY7XFV2_9BACL|nr:energy-coupling factor transporter transmembrane component T [Paenibacillus urinalis]WDH96478.1 energy-coupling factor transporter transmembrane component T [Paenibacillus urinalis]WDI04701.1 energy-coupling factor transporter transmembrane component T [Paenibacillus urinalis]
MDIVRKTLDRISVERIKLELLGTAYGRSTTFIGRLDPRTLLLWYLFFATVPWFIHNTTVLFGMFVFIVSMTALARVSYVILIILTLGLVGQVGWMFLFSMLFGGSLETLLPLLTLTLKLSVISLASIAVFSSMDPEKLSDGLSALGVPEAFSFSLSYGYRILPTLLSEFHQILLSYRLRGRSPERPGMLYFRNIFYYLRILVLSFYPLMLNTAKRSRTTVEALETRGFTYGMNHPEVKKLRLSYLKVRAIDVYFIIFSFAYITWLFWFGERLPNLLY